MLARILPFLLLFLLGCGKPITEKKEKSYYVSALLEGISEEILLDTTMSFNFDYLPLEGELATKGKFWSGDSWRLDKGAINYRWNSPGKEGFNYYSPGVRESFTYPRSLIEQLSPAEKYDLYMGRYDYPLRWEVDWLARTGTEAWEGLCHGWAGATINHKEPGPRIMTNPDGVEVPFGSSDIKALLTWAYSKALVNENEMLGKRCDETAKNISEDHCDDDLTAVSFHVVVANKLGLRSQPLIADVDRYREVWNHPILSYKTTVEKMQGTKKGRIGILRTEFVYLDVIETNSWEKQAPVRSRMTVRYELELDKAGNIVRGKWLSRERPDFLWTISEKDVFTGYLEGIKDLL